MDMEHKSNFRARVMKYAHQYYNATKKAWSECVKMGWKLFRLAKAMRQGVVAFCYRKVDGTMRTAHGTLQNVPAGATLNGKRVTKPSYKTMTYFDTEKQDFRCFKIENLISAV